jgi:hypothetical protein
MLSNIPRMRTESGREIVSSRGIFILKRFFADWVVVFFGHFFENYSSSPYFRSVFSTVEVMYYFLQKTDKA